MLKAMGDEMTPHAALAAAAAARSAAPARVVPGWFPVAAAPAFAAGMTLVGVSLLVGGGAMWVLGLTGAVVLAGFAALWGALVTWWRRRGVVPPVPRLDQRLSARQRRAAVAADFAAIALALVTLGVTGRLGWAAIAAGWFLGGALWYRLRLRAA